MNRPATDRASPDAQASPGPRATVAPAWQVGERLRTLGWPRLAPGLALAAILALSVALRFYNLAGQSFWNDEGTSVALAGRSLQLITLGAAADIHPPFYHYLLHYWLRLFGAGEVGARSLSAVLGVAAVGLTGLLGRRLFGTLAGWLAALLAAVSSYQVYYAQEARMYMLLTCLGVASTYLFWLGWLEPQVPRRRLAMAGWVAVTTLAVYTHYLAVGLLLAQNAAWLAGLLPGLGGDQRRAVRPLQSAATWALAQAVVGLLFLPWLRLTWGQLHQWPAVSQSFGLLELLRRALALFALGPVVDERPLRWLAAGMLGLALLGLAWPGRPGERSACGRILAALYWAAPVGVLYYLSRSRPVYHPKFLVQATPGFLLLAGRGLAVLAPRRGMASSHLRGWARGALACGALLLALGASLPGLRNCYFDSRYARDDYRGIAQYVSAVGHPGDLVLICAPSQIETVGHYYQGPARLLPIPLHTPPDREDTAGELAAATSDAVRVFGIFWADRDYDPERVIEGWLETHAYKALDAWYGGVRLVIYAMPAGDVGEAGEQRVDADLGGQARLEGYGLPGAQAAGGDILQLQLYWQATTPMERRYKVFTHILDEAGRLVGQRDSEPCGGLCPTDTWRPGERIVDRYGLPIQPGTPPGEYLVEVGMYDPSDGQRLPVTQDGQATGDRVILQRVRLARPAAPPPLGVLDMQRRRSIAGDDISLLGFSFGRLGALDQGPVPLQPGEAAELTLFWQAARGPKAEQEMLVRVVDGRGRVVLEERRSPVDGRYPVRQWQAREIVRDPLHLRLPPDVRPGRYRLLLGWGAAPAAKGLPRLHELLAFVVQ